MGGGIPNRRVARLVYQFVVPPLGGRPTRLKAELQTDTLPWRARSVSDWSLGRSLSARLHRSQTPPARLLHSLTLGPRRLPPSLSFADSDAHIARHQGR